MIVAPKKYTLAQIRKALETHMYSCCTYAAQAELLRDRVLSELRYERKGK